MLLNQNPVKKNLSKAEETALKDLSKDTHITIKPADKGGAIVIQNTKDYVKEGMRQLGDKNTYERLNEDPVDIYSDIVENKITEMMEEKEITPKMAGTLRNLKPRTPHIYFLPKIHKGVLPPPGRPVVSANGCPTEKISAFVDSFLKPMVPEIDSYVKDTTDFINKIESL